MSKLEISRRTFLIVTGSAAGGMAIGVGALSAAEPALPSAVDAPADITAAEVAGKEVNAWITIEPDDSITIRLAQAEMGQGVSTALPQIIAEELDCDWSRVNVTYAEANRNLNGKPYGSMMTVGSRSVRAGHLQLKRAGANGRARLIAAAAQRWGVDPTTCTASMSKVMHKASGKTLTYGALAADAANVTLAAEPALKDPKTYTLIGKSLKRVDTPVKINGAATFGIDAVVPGMVHAAAVMCPSPGGAVKSYDEAAIKGRRGVLQVVALPNGVAVVADKYWRARTALDAMKVEWDLGVGAGVNSADVDKAYREAALTAPMLDLHSAGDVNAAFSGAKVIEAMYETPHLAHAPMEPLNCTADVKADRVDIWMGTQSTDNVAPAVARLVGLTPDKVHMHNHYLGGGFGRRSQTDEVSQAVLISKVIGKPVKVIWSREDDIRNDNFRPQAAVAFKGVVSGGKISALHVRSACGALAPVRGKPETKPGKDNASIESLTNHPYTIPNQKFEGALKNTHLPTTYWRSVGSSINTFVMEGFIDELAYAAGADPYQFRRAMIAHADWLGVLDEAAKRSDWGKPLPKGRGRGIAIGEAMGSICAQVAEVTVSPRGELKVDRIVATYDSGHIINPRLVEAQVEGSVVYGLSAALYGEITVKDGAVVQSNFHNYEMVTLEDCPKIEVYPALSGGEKWGGIGEPAVPPTAPAVANAVFAATGKRIRRLPLKHADLSQA